MKKKKLIISIIIVLVVLAIIVFVISKNKNKTQESKLVQIYNEITENQSYYFEIEQNDENKTIMAKNGDKTVIDSYSGGTRSTTLIKDGNTYIIFHDREEYYVFDTDNVEQTILTDGIEELLKKNFKTGQEKIKGKKCTYEEYEGSTFFIMSNMLDLDENDTKTRLYFDKNNQLVYVKIINSQEAEILKITLTKEADNSLFEIPSNYAEN